MSSVAPPVAAASAASAPASSGAASYTLETLPFDNLALRTLPIDTETKNFVRHVPNACFSLVSPEPVKNPVVVSVSPSALSLLGLPAEETTRPEFAEYFSGNKLLPGSRPAAHVYCGHQFGHFSGQLGDGAAMYLGEVVANGERTELQLKGAGPTPFSRAADGRKVLRSSIREFLCSEAHHFLGIATTRAATLVTSDTRVVRDVFYDGNAIQERASIVSRLAPSFLRFGSFEIAKGEDSITGRSGPSPGRTDLLKAQLDYVVDTFYASVPAVAAATTREDKYLAFFRELTQRTALLVAQWQAIGWCHGVLNTDNMSILGLTIDFGPFGFVESFDPDYICNGSDNEGRYRYEAQPEICGWNLLKLSQVLEPFMPKQAMRDIVGEYEEMYTKCHLDIHKRKLGLGVMQVATQASASPRSSSSTDETKDDASDSTSETDEAYSELIDAFYSTLTSTGGDFTNSFRCLSSFGLDDASAEKTLATLVAQSATLAQRLSLLAPRIPAQQWAMIQHLMATQPHIFQQRGMEEQRVIIDQEMERQKARTALEKRDPEQHATNVRDQWKAWLDQYTVILRADQARALTQGLPAESWISSRLFVQNSSNPKYILRNWIAQEVIAAAEAGDYEPVRECLRRLSDPFDVADLGETQAQSQAEAQVPATSDDNPNNAASAATSSCGVWNKARPAWANSLKVTCSS